MNVSVSPSIFEAKAGMRAALINGAAGADVESVWMKDAYCKSLHKTLERHMKLGHPNACANLNVPPKRKKVMKALGKSWDAQCFTTLALPAVPWAELPFMPSAHMTRKYDMFVGVPLSGCCSVACASRGSTWCSGPLSTRCLEQPCGTNGAIWSKPMPHFLKHRCRRARASCARLASTSCFACLPGIW